MDIQEIGKWLVVAGLVVLVTGGLLILLGRLPFFGQLPGDFTFQGQNVSCFVPLGTMIVVSLLLTVLLNIVLRWLNK